MNPGSIGSHLLWAAITTAVIFRIGFVREIVTGIKASDVDPNKPGASRALYI